MLTQFIKNVKFCFCSFMSLKKRVNMLQLKVQGYTYWQKGILTKKYAFDFDHIENTHLVL